MHTIPSVRNSGAYATGVINAEVPTTKRILKILLPTILPTAISALPLIAAVTLVTSSGREVPKATMVRPINRSLMPKISASAVAASTATSEPSTIMTPPSTINANIFQTGIGFSSGISSGRPPPFFAMTSRYPR